VDLQRGGPDGAAHATAPRELAAVLLKLPGVVGVELLDEGEGEGGVSRVLVRARGPQRFFEDFGRLVVEEWLEVRRLEPLDDSARAVLGYLLAGQRAP
jgi:ABC-2 type transport system ATP-binding protein